MQTGVRGCVCMHIPRMGLGWGGGGRGWWWLRMNERVSEEGDEEMLMG